MPWWAWTMIGLAVYAPLWRWTFRSAWEDPPGKTWADFWESLAIATFLFWLWAAWSLCEAVSQRWRPDRLARIVGGESRWARRERRERELREREERVQRLERELGL